MTIPELTTASVMAWLLALAFAGAGLFNAIGGAAVRAQFQRWGYPAWWNWVTAAVEMPGAALILVPETRIWGLALGAVVMMSVIATVVWRRDYKHLPPGAPLAALIGIELTLVVVH